MQQTTAQGWHIGDWGLWGWIETVIKLIGIGAGLVAGIRAMGSSGDFIIANNPHLAAVILVALLTLLCVGALFMRFQQQEVISFVFWALNLLGHIGVLVALLRLPGHRTLPLIFGGFIVLGEIAKQRFLAVSGYTEAGRSTGGMLNFSRVILGVYVLFIILVLL
jgi:hypothetical protein